MSGRLRGTWLAAGAAVLVAAVAVLVAVLLPGTSSGQPASHPTRAVSLPKSTGPPTPAHGAYFGAWVSPTVYAAGKYTQQDRVLAVDSLQKTIKRRLDIVHIYLTQNGQFPTSSDLAFVNQGSTLLVSWALNNSSKVAKGKYDVSIIERAREIKKIGKPVFLEWRWEMDRPNLKAQVGSPAEYIAAWKHIRDVFAQQGVTNVAWVWCPTSKGFTNGTAGAYYPGDSEVDWICADVYPSGGPAKSVRDGRRPLPPLGRAPPQQAGDDRRIRCSIGLLADGAGTMAARSGPDGGGQPADQGAGLLRRTRGGPIDRRT